MAEKLTVQCPYCNFMMVQVTECKDLIVLCPSCGASVKVSATDEVRAIMESRGKLYTQIKIDEINNLGVVKIRLRSMLAAIEEQKRHRNEEK